MSVQGEIVVDAARARRKKERLLAGGLAVAGVVMLGAVRAWAGHDNDLSIGGNCAFGSYNGPGTANTAPACGSNTSMCVPITVSCCVDHKCTDSGSSYKGSVKQTQGEKCYDVTAQKDCIKNTNTDPSYQGTCCDSITS